MSDLRWPLPARTISASSLGTFARCAEQYRRRYVLGERIAPGASAVLGNAVHGSAEKNYAHKIATGDDMPISDVEEAYAWAFEEEVERNGGSGEIQWSIKYGSSKMDVTPGKAKSIGVPVARTYRETVAPKVEPLGAEEWFELELPGIPVPLVGKIDLITETHKVDLKFGAQAKKKPDLSWRTQAQLYMLADQTDNLTGIGGKGFEWHTGSWGSARYQPQVHTAREMPDLALEQSEQNRNVAQAVIRSLVVALVAFWEAFGPDQAWPGTGLSSTWSCDYCGYRPSCPYWTGEAYSGVVREAKPEPTLPPVGEPLTLL